MTVPTYEFLSAPLWLIDVLHIVTLTVHFLVMNLLVGGLLVVLLGRFSNRWLNPIVQRYIQLLPTMMAMTITFGVAPLLFLQLVYPRQVYSAAIISGWLWLGIVAAVLITYYLIYMAAWSKGPPKRTTLLMTLSLVGLAYVSILYSSVFSLAESPDLMKEVYSESQSGCRINPDVGSYLFRWLHMITGAVAVGGFFFGLLGRHDDEAHRVGRGFFLWGTVAAALIGLIYLFTLGDNILGFMRSPAIWTLTAGIVLAAGVLHFYFKRKFVVASAMLLVSFLTMVITRHYLRLLRLEGYFQPDTLAVQPQWGVFTLFVVFLLLAVALVWYMLRLFFRNSETSP